MHLSSQTHRLRKPPSTPKASSSHSPKLSPPPFPPPLIYTISFSGVTIHSAAQVRSQGIILEFFSTSEPLTKSCQFNFPKIFQINFFFSIFTTTPSVQESISCPGAVLVHSNQQGRARCPSSHHWGGLMEPQAARMYHSFASVQE